MKVSSSFDIGCSKPLILEGLGNVWERSQGGFRKVLVVCRWFWEVRAGFGMVSADFTKDLNRFCWISRGFGKVPWGVAVGAGILYLAPLRSSL